MNTVPRVGDVLMFDDKSMVVLVVRERVGEVDVLWLHDENENLVGEVSGHYSHVGSWQEWVKL